VAPDRLVLKNQTQVVLVKTLDAAQVAGRHGAAVLGRGWGRVERSGRGQGQQFVARGSDRTRERQAAAPRFALAPRLLVRQD
jgi:hypothetical protein